MTQFNIDFHSLEIFVAVAECRNFTSAGESLGLTQSAVSRRIQDLEESLGICLIQRTTRRVSLTPAGERWLKQSIMLLKQRDTSVREFRVIHGIDAPRIRLGLGDSIPFAHLPGILARRGAERLEITTGMDEALIDSLLKYEVDLVVANCPQESISGIEVLHTYDDQFVLISPSQEPGVMESFIGLNRKGELGNSLGSWVEENAPASETEIEVDTFDLAINLVSLGFGSSLVPRRALAVYGKRKPVKRFEIDPPFSRRIIIAARKEAQLPTHVNEFIESILFSESP